MIFRAHIAAAFILFSQALCSQEKYVIDWDYEGQSFEAFAMKTESRYPVRFFYNKEWITGFTLGSYGGKLMLNEVLDKFFEGKSIFWYGIETGNIILTKPYQQTG